MMLMHFQKLKIGRKHRCVKMFPGTPKKQSFAAYSTGWPTAYYWSDTQYFCLICGNSASGHGIVDDIAMTLTLLVPNGKKHDLLV